MENFYLKNEQDTILKDIKEREKNIQDAIVSLNRFNFEKLKNKVEHNYINHESINKKMFDKIDYLTKQKSELVFLYNELEINNTLIQNHKRLLFIEETYNKKISKIREKIETKKCDIYDYPLFVLLEEEFSNWERELRKIKGNQFIRLEERNEISKLLLEEIREIMNFNDKTKFDLKEYLLILLELNSNNLMCCPIEFDFRKFLEGVEGHILNKKELEDIIVELKQNNPRIHKMVMVKTIDTINQKSSI